jgi:GNAT superfamily N-acetyltransferase
MRVVRLMDEPDWQSRLSPIEEIFFATSPSAKTLRPDERKPFKERWLGRYIAYDIESFFVAITEVSTVAGYLAGCLDNPAHNPRFADMGYYPSFEALCDYYPCHLHINLDERYRNRGIGSALIDAFAAQAANAGHSGIHVVTGERARNVRFYEKNEFRSLATVRWNGANAVFMARLLRPPLTQRHFDKATCR